ncbi:MAG TPA: rubredoxin [Candidatus Bathyarchaeia archaeon]|nr:rubredoxin [Candidatus Bathyarchaeia archaeon]
MGQERPWGSGTPFENLPDDRTCRSCGSSKDQFEKEE